MNWEKALIFACVVLIVVVGLIVLHDNGVIH